MLKTSLLTLFMGLIAAPLAAEAPQGIESATLIQGWRAPDGTHVAALEIRLKDGWKTYWRAPGDAGVPPLFDWSGSENLSAVEVTWPAPLVFDTAGMQTIGYKNVMVLPLKLTPTTKGQDIALDGRIELGICKDICMPVSLRVNTALDEDAAQRDPRIAAALAARPYSAEEAGVGQVVCEIAPEGDALLLRAEIRMPRVAAREVAVVETNDPNIWVAEAKTHREGDRLVAETKLVSMDGAPVMLNRSGLRITVIGDHDAVDIQGCSGR